MFTGIIKKLGLLNKKIVHNGGGTTSLEITSGLHPKPGASISINGVCLTVSKISKKSFLVDVVPETLSRTNIGKLKTGASLNLEPSLRMGDSLDGHFVTGHIDGTGTVLRLEKTAKGSYLSLSLPPKLKRFIIEKGSMALNGVSLTIAQVSKETFSVAMIPYTLKHTNLAILKKGDLVNIEVDILARYSQTP